jgi:hypothetical protein
VTFATLISTDLTEEDGLAGVGKETMVSSDDCSNEDRLSIAEPTSASCNIPDEPKVVSANKPAADGKEDDDDDESEP